jgi:hypothetical protein
VGGVSGAVDAAAPRSRAEVALVRSDSSDSEVVVVDEDGLPQVPPTAVAVPVSRPRPPSFSIQIDDPRLSMDDYVEVRRWKVLCCASCVATAACVCVLWCVRVLYIVAATTHPHSVALPMHCLSVGPAVRSQRST